MKSNRYFVLFFSIFIFSSLFLLGQEGEEKFGNCNHPELQSGEVFLTNCFDPPEEGDIIIYRDDPGYEGIEWETKRKGDKAYTEDGEVITGAFPVFVQRSELEKAEIEKECMKNK